MNKRIYAYRLLLTSASSHRELEINSHEEIFAIMEIAKDRQLFATDDDAAQFALGIKLFGEVMLRHRDLDLFKEFQPAFDLFMKKLKAK